MLGFSLFSKTQCRKPPFRPCSLLICSHQIFAVDFLAMDSRWEPSVLAHHRGVLLDLDRVSREARDVESKKQFCSKWSIVTGCIILLKSDIWTRWNWSSVAMHLISNNNETGGNIQTIPAWYLKGQRVPWRDSLSKKLQKHQQPEVFTGSRSGL